MMDWNLNTRSEWEWDNMKNMQFSTHDQNQTQENVDFSFSPSADSSSKFGDLPKDFLEKDESSSSWIRENGTTCLISTMVEEEEEEEASTVFSGDAMIGLKLGRHASSSNTCRSNSETTATTSSVSLSSSSPMIKRSRSASYLSSRCQVEGCNLDLSSSKDYHRRHRICAHHSKSPTVVVAGMERRFCQQCSRFHDLSEFDDRKRSCRRRLSAHNARRRRPQSEEIQFGSSSICDRRPQMNFLLNRASMVACRDSVPPESSCDSLLGLAKGGGMPTNNGAVHFGSERFMTRSINHNGTMDATSNSILSGDVRNAFSLLSTSSWPSNWPEEPSSFDQFGQLNSISLSQPQIPLELQISTNTNTNQLQNLHSFRSPREFERFYSN